MRAEKNFLELGTLGSESGADRGQLQHPTHPLLAKAPPRLGFKAADRFHEARAERNYRQKEHKESLRKWKPQGAHPVASVPRPKPQMSCPGRRPPAGPELGTPLPGGEPAGDWEWTVPRGAAPSPPPGPTQQRLPGLGRGGGVARRWVGAGRGGRVWSLQQLPLGPLP